MPSPSFLTKAFIAGFFFGHLFIPAEKSWLFKLARSSPAFDNPLPALSGSNATSTRNGPQLAQDVDSQRYLENDLPALVPPSLGNLSVSSTLSPSPYPTSTHSSANHQPTLSPELSALVLPNNSDPMTYRPSATQATVSTTLYYVYGLPSASALPPIPRVAIPQDHVTGPGPSIRFGITFRSLLCICILLYHITPVIFRNRAPKRKTQKLPERAVSMIISNLQGDHRSLKACSLVSRSWTKESHRHLFHTISLTSRQSADLWFSPDTLSLARHVRSIRLSMETVAGTERELSRFPCVETLRVLDWRGSRHSLPTGWSPLDRTVDHLELVQPEGTPHELLTFVSFFMSLESLYITRSREQSRCEVRTTRTVDPETVSIRFRMLRYPPANGVGLTRPCFGNEISVWLYFNPQDIDEPLTVLLGCSNAQTIRSCGRCFTGRSLAYPLARPIHPRFGPTLSILRINDLPEEMISITDSLLISLPCISPRSTKVTIGRFRDVDGIPVDEILPRFRSLGGVVEIGDQRIRI